MSNGHQGRWTFDIRTIALSLGVFATLWAGGSKLHEWYVAPIAKIPEIEKATIANAAAIQSIAETNVIQSETDKNFSAQLVLAESRGFQQQVNMEDICEKWGERDASRVSKEYCRDVLREKRMREAGRSREP